MGEGTLATNGGTLAGGRETLAVSGRTLAGGGGTTLAGGGGGTLASDVARDILIAQVQLTLDTRPRLEYKYDLYAEVTDHGLFTCLDSGSNSSSNSSIASEGTLTGS